MRTSGKEMDEEKRRSLIAMILAVEKFKNKRFIDVEIERSQELLQGIMDIDLSPEARKELRVRANTQMMYHLVRKYG